MQELDLPSVSGTGSRADYALHEEDDQFVLTVEMPGYDPEGIDVAWDDGVLNIAAEHVGRTGVAGRPTAVGSASPRKGAIEATYDNGVLEVTLPFTEGATPRGTEIPIEA